MAPPVVVDARPEAVTLPPPAPAEFATGPSSDPATDPSPDSTLAPSTSAVPASDTGSADRRWLVLTALVAVVGIGVVVGVSALRGGGTDEPADAVVTEPAPESETAASTVRSTTTAVSTTIASTNIAPAPPVEMTAAPASTTTAVPEVRRPTVIIDSDANNELDDQFAIAYLLLSEEFDVAGVTVNRTTNGGDIGAHAAEARRIVELVDHADVPVLEGASATYEDIESQLAQDGFDGHEAVDFIIRTVREHEGDDKVEVIAIGKLTNVALALERAPDIAEGMSVIWLGSNYPDRGPEEYNLVHDVDAVNRVLDSTVDFEMAVVRVGMDSGTAALTVTPEEIEQHLAGQGPTVAPVTHPRRGSFTTFGDYAVALMEEHVEPGDLRSLYDVGAVAIALDPSWADPEDVPAPIANPDTSWTDRPHNPRLITIRDDFQRDAIIGDLYETVATAGD